MSVKSRSSTEKNRQHARFLDPALSGAPRSRPRRPSVRRNKSQWQAFRAPHGLVEQDCDQLTLSMTATVNEAKAWAEAIGLERGVAEVISARLLDGEVLHAVALQGLAPWTEFMRAVGIEAGPAAKAWLRLTGAHLPSIMATQPTCVGVPGNVSLPVQTPIVQLRRKRGTIGQPESQAPAIDAIFSRTKAHSQRVTMSSEERGCRSTSNP